MDSPEHSIESLVLQCLAENGLLLLQDKRLPSVVTLVTGASLSASWWGHPDAHRVFATLAALEDHPDVMFTKLLYGKVTLVHRKLWPALLAVALSRLPWQFDGLSAAAKELFQSVETRPDVRAAGRPVKELEKRLLVNTRQVHTESGRHAIVVESWNAWAARSGCEAHSSLSKARHIIGHAVELIGGTPIALPWTHDPPNH